MQPQPQQQIEVKITDEMTKGVYANAMRVMHTPEEFVLDFMNILAPHGSVTARVIISPGHFKRIIAALQENLGKYEQSFGAIKALPGQAASATGVSDSSESHKIGFNAD